MKLKSQILFFILLLRTCLSKQEEKATINYKEERILDWFQDIFSDACDIKDIQLPENGEKWTCDKDVTMDAVPKNTKCRLQCVQEYEVEIGKYQDA